MRPIKKQWSKDHFVHFNDTDLGGVVFFANTFKIAHQLFEIFLVEECGLSWDLWFQNESWAVPVKEANCDYSAPLFAGEFCKGKVRLIQLGDSSAVFETQISQRNRLCAAIQTVHVFVSLQTHKKIAIPDVIRKSLSPR